MNENLKWTTIKKQKRKKSKLEKRKFDYLTKNAAGKGYICTNNLSHVFITKKIFKILLIYFHPVLHVSILNV